LAVIGSAPGNLGAEPYGIQHRQEQRGQDRNDGNHHQQLNQSERRDFFASQTFSKHTIGLELHVITGFPLK
jgi:hypothetical protein